jgi:hypothetical protein
VGNGWQAVIYLFLLSTLIGSWVVMKNVKNRLVLGVANLIALVSMMLLFAAVLPTSCKTNDCGHDYDKQGAYKSC